MRGLKPAWLESRPKASVWVDHSDPKTEEKASKYKMQADRPGVGVEPFLEAKRAERPISTVIKLWGTTILAIVQ